MQSTLCPVLPRLQTGCWGASYASRIFSRRNLLLFAKEEVGTGTECDGEANVGQDQVQPQLQEIHLQEILLEAEQLADAIHHGGKEDAQDQQIPENRGKEVGHFFVGEGRGKEESKRNKNETTIDTNKDEEIPGNR